MEADTTCPLKSGERRVFPEGRVAEFRQVAARRRVDGLREEADRIQVELAAAELEWQEWVIARRRVDTVPAPNDGNTAEAEVTGDPQNTDAPPPRDAAMVKSQVPVAHHGLAWSVLSVVLVGATALP
ncbi:hypothetical protein [Streptomyces adelaidensis]|uniref:hypothetical protein n=1 Tax=Streptomyces adelaidensis TaxID=2796465 RepID=UPI001F3FCEDF|nr:hypothetical protein [Streptomyces adelaidensis]